MKEAFKYTKAQRNVIVGGAVILICITALSCVSSFMIYREGFADLPFLFQQALALFAVVVVEGAFIWLLYGFTRAFSSAMERLISFVGMAFLVGVMLTNLVTHFMMVKRVTLAPFQQSWIDWGAVTVFIVVLLTTLFVTLADPVIRLMRLQLRLLGLQREKEIERQAEQLEEGNFPAEIEAESRETGPLMSGKDFRR